MRAAASAGGVYCNDRLTSSDLATALMDHVDLGIWVVDADLNIVAINALARKVLDFPAELIGPGLTLETLIRFNAVRGDFGEGNVEDLVRERLELARNIAADSFEFTQPDGNTVFVKRTLLADGGFVTTYLDKRNGTPAPVQHTETSLARLEDVMDSMEQGVILWNADQRCETVNERAYELLDINETFLKVGMKHAEFLARSSKRGDLSESELDFVKQSLARGEIFSFDRTTPSGRIVTTDVRPRADGGFVVTFSDMTELRRRETELVSARQAAEAAVTAKSEFLANMSHEIRTPMNGVLGMAELLARTDLDTKQNHYARIIVKSGQALLTIINDILDFAKIEAGQMEIRPVPFELAEMIEDVATLLAANAAQKGIELAVRVQPDLPNKYVGDVGRLRQVITNLVGNAVKFTGEGHVLVDVSGTVEGGEAHLKFRVEDTGIGIAQDKLDLIFEQFSQADTSATRDHEGTGLGLAISSRLVSLMGGEIHVESREGEGSCFWLIVSVPVHANDDISSRVPVDVSGASVLIIDDNEINRNILMEQMAAWQFKAAAVTNGTDGLQALHEQMQYGNGFDIAILNCDMPEMDGLEVVERIRNSAEIAATPLLMLTSAEQSDIGDHLKKLGVDAHLIKPAGSSLLLETIVDVLQGGGERGAGRPVPRPQPAICKPVAHAPDPGEPAAGSVDILIAEDNEVNQIVYAQILGETGYSFRIAKNGARALELFHTLRPRIMLMDISMPRISGLEVTGAIRSEEADTGRHLPIIGVTAHALAGDREKCLEAGMDDYLPKPIDPHELVTVINRWLDGEAQFADGETVELKGCDENQAYQSVAAPKECGKLAGVSPRILFVEDNEISHGEFLQLMAVEPFDVTSVRNGREAVVQYIARPDAFDVIVMDIAMPVMNGYQAAQAIRAHERVKSLQATPIIGAGAHTSDEHRRLAAVAGMDDYLTKPVNIDEFAACLEKLQVKRGGPGLKETMDKITAPSGVAAPEPAQQFTLTMADIVRRSESRCTFPSRGARRQEGLLSRFGR